MVKAQNKMPLVEKLKKYNENRPTYFCIPGHRFERGVSEAWLAWEDRAFLQYDLTEAYGLDDLHQPEGAIKEAQNLAAKLFGARESFFLVNGTTGGNQAMVLTAAGPGEEIIIPRNAHKSILMGLIMSGARPVYVMPEWIPQWGIYGGVSPQTIECALDAHPDCRSVLLVSPDYYGITSDLAKISEVCAAHQALLLVDEAHGAHVYFSELLPKGALQYADICAQSLHKVTGALTQSSILHVGSERISVPVLKQNLQMVQSTSPSYLLMASLDAARFELAQNGKNMIEGTLQLAAYIKEKIGKISGIQYMDENIIGQNAVHELDGTRLTITAIQLGFSGFALKDLLMEKYGVDTELADEQNVLVILTFANIREEAERLVDALQEIARTNIIRDEVQQGQKVQQVQQGEKSSIISIPDMVLTPREAHFHRKRSISWQEAKGTITGEAVIPYPPGTPLIYPGERIDNEVWNHLENLRRQQCHFQGISDSNLNTLKIIDESMENPV